jgi:hypothetical protein
VGGMLIKFERNNERNNAVASTTSRSISMFKLTELKALQECWARLCLQNDSANVIECLSSFLFCA